MTIKERLRNFVHLASLLLVTGSAYCAGVLNEYNHPGWLPNRTIVEAYESTKEGANTLLIDSRLPKDYPNKIENLEQYLRFIDIDKDEQSNWKMISHYTEAFQMIATYKLNLPIGIDGIPGPETFGAANNTLQDEILISKYRHSKRKYRTAKREFPFDGKIYSLSIPNVALEDLPKYGRRDYAQTRGDKDPLIQRLTRDITRKIKSKKKRAERIVAFAQSQINYRYEPDEFIKHPLETLQDGVGDCDDTTVLIDSMLRAAGFDTRIVSAHLKGEKYGHAFVLVEGEFKGISYGLDGKTFSPVETTSQRPIGWINEKYQPLHDASKFSRLQLL